MMRHIKIAPTVLRSIVAYTLAGVAFSAALLGGYLTPVPGALTIVLPFAAAYAVLLALSRTARFHDACRERGNTFPRLISILLIAIVLLWSLSVTDLFDQVSALNDGTPLTISLLLDLTAVGLLIVAALTAGQALSGREALDISRIHPFMALNGVVLVYALAAIPIAILPANPNPLILIAAAGLMTLGYLRAAIHSKTDPASLSE